VDTPALEDSDLFFLNGCQGWYAWSSNRRLNFFICPGSYQDQGAGPGYQHTAC